MRWLQPEVEFHYVHDFVHHASDAGAFAMTAGFVMPLHSRLRINTGIQQTLAGRNTDQETVFSIVSTVFF